MPEERSSPPTESGFISARHIQYFIARGYDVGLPMAEIIQEAELREEQFLDANAWIPAADLETLMLAVLRRYHDPLIGLHLSDQIQPAVFGVLGFIVQSCHRVSDVLDTIMRFRDLTGDVGRPSLVLEPGAVVWRWECLTGGELFKRQAREYILGCLVTVVRLVLERDEKFPAAIHFRHPAPEKPGLLRDYVNFFRCPIYFDQPHSSVIMSHAMTQYRLKHSDLALRETLEAHASRLLDMRRSQHSLLDQVRYLLNTMLIKGVPSRDAVASQLGMSSRNLHRKLQAEGCSYHDILDKLRIEIAQNRLLAESCSINDLAEQLGFNSASALIRWFRQMTGMTPGEYRHIHQISAAAANNSPADQP